MLCYTVRICFAVPRGQMFVGWKAWKVWEQNNRICWWPPGPLPGLWMNYFYWTSWTANLCDWCACVLDVVDDLDDRDQVDVAKPETSKLHLQELSQWHRGKAGKREEDSLDLGGFQGFIFDHHTPGTHQAPGAHTPGTERPFTWFILNAWNAKDMRVIITKRGRTFTIF